MSEYVLRMRSDRLAPAIQPGDHLTVRQADTAEPGQLVVTAGTTCEARVDHYDGTGEVVGIVTHVYRRVP